MCIRDSISIFHPKIYLFEGTDKSELIIGSSNLTSQGLFTNCLLYTSDAADERSSVDLGGRRIIKKKNRTSTRRQRDNINAQATIQESALHH